MGFGIGDCNLALEIGMGFEVGLGSVSFLQSFCTLYFHFDV